MRKCSDPEIGQKIGLYEFDCLSHEEKEKFEQHLLECDACFQELYEFSPAVEVIQENINEFRKAVKIKKPVFEKVRLMVSSFFGDIYPFSRKRIRKKPKDFLIPAFASVMVCVLIILIFKPGFVYQPIVKTDNGKPQKIVLHEPEEMEAKSTMEKISEEINVKLSEDKEKIVIMWKEITEAEFYNIDLTKDSEKKRLTPPAGIQETSFAFNADLLHFDTKYILQVSGKLKYGGDFKITKEFVKKK